MVHATEYVNGYNEVGTDHLQQGRAFAQKALELDPGETWAHQAMAMNCLWQKDFAGAEAAARRSVEAAPNYVGGYVALGQVLDFTSRREAAIEALEHARRLDPHFDMTLHLDRKSVV